MSHLEQKSKFNLEAAEISATKTLICSKYTLLILFLFAKNEVYYFKSIKDHFIRNKN